MNKLKIDFKIDIISGEIIKTDEILKILKNNKSKNYYLSEIANYHYIKTYGKNIVEILSDFYDIPKCPITGENVCYKLAGYILFGKYSSSCTSLDISNHIVNNNENYKKHIESMKKTRIGSGNPMYGVKAWNKGLSKNEDERVLSISKKRLGIKFSDKTLEKMSISAKKRKKHGHTGHKHTDETKQKLREITIKRYTLGVYKKTKSEPHNKVKKIIEEIYGINYDGFIEEFQYGNFVFDFKIDKNLIEVQGDYFHCNPETRHSIPKNELQKKNFERDIRKRSFVKSKEEYNLLEIWENDINNNLKLVKSWIKSLKK